MQNFHDKNVMLDPSIEQKLLARCPLVGAAVMQSEQYFKADVKVVLPAHIGAISAILGPVLKVKTPNQQVSNSALFILAMSPPATKKTPIMDRAYRPIYSFENGLSEINEKAERTYNSEMALWKARERCLRREERNCPGFPGQMEEIHQKMESHSRSIPEKMGRKQMLFENLTEAGIVSTLQATKAACIATSEGVNVTGSKTLDSIGMFNSLHSGSPVTVNRGSREPVRVTGAALSICIFTQNEMMSSIPKAKKKKLLDTGFLQRFLVFNNEPDHGIYQDVESGYGTEAMDIFEMRLEELSDLLLSAICDNNFVQRVVGFDAAATDFWNVKEKSIRSEMQSGGSYEYAADHASKLANNAARLASLLHLFEGKDGEISRDTLEISFDICELCSKDYMKVFAKGPEHVTDAELLFEKLEDFYEMGRYPIPKVMARRNAPLPLREGKRFFKALSYLESEHRVRVVQGQDGKQYIFFPDNLPPQYIDRSQFGMTSLDPFR
ncbi:MAG: DUF3987 domain-containing protein [Alcanivoracaceae bacterium]|nr:DUF3987 domain-containing protein [Alcanivoracaceae bacterium]